jgi:UDP-N-acetyl-D-galactosamine dehydrogenase
MNLEDLKLAIIGLGYVGLPLSVEFAKSRSVVGFDINKSRIEELKNGYDSTNELSVTELSQAKGLIYSHDIKDLVDCNCYIVTVPTPVDEFNRPNISTLLTASSIIGNVLSNGNIVIYESTVYPGVTEEECGPVLATKSGLSYANSKMSVKNNIFYLGYSPERVNPGDKAHRISDIVKITSGSTPEIADLINQLYASIIPAGTYKASNIRVAEAAKVIENIQRDVNIALINELAIIFEKLHINTNEVLQAAGTKWNFLPFQPGLVGGHCIGVDPYYLTHKAQQIGYSPEMILAGRRVNDAMANYVAERVIKLMLKKEINVLRSHILVLGVTFKENCPDIRNSKVIDMINELHNYKCNVDVHDPWVNKKFLPENLKGKFVSIPKFEFYDAIILAVRHKKFINQGAKKIHQYGKTKHVFFDLKYAFRAQETDEQL